MYLHKNLSRRHYDILNIFEFIASSLKKSIIHIIEVIKKLNFYEKSCMYGLAEIVPPMEFTVDCLRLQEMVVPFNSTTISILECRPTMTQ